MCSLLLGKTEKSCHVQRAMGKGNIIHINNINRISMSGNLFWFADRFQMFEPFEYFFFRNKTTFLRPSWVSCLGPRANTLFLEVGPSDSQYQLPIRHHYHLVIKHTKTWKCSYMKNGWNKQRSGSFLPALPDGPWYQMKLADLFFSGTVRRWSDKALRDKNCWKRPKVCRSGFIILGSFWFLSLRLKYHVETPLNYKTVVSWWYTVVVYRGFFVIFVVCAGHRFETYVTYKYVQLWILATHTNTIL